MTQTLSLSASVHTPRPSAQTTEVHTRVSSTEILRGQKTVEINHNGSTYKLQATRLGKLILTK